MLQRVRQFFHDSDVTVGVVAGVVAGFVLVPFVGSVVTTFFIPPVTEVFGRCGQSNILASTQCTGGQSKVLTADYFGTTIDWGFPLAALMTFVIVVAIIYAVFAWVRTPTEQQELTTRECPECKSEIWADARRCRFCTSAVEPLDAGAAPEA